MPITDISTPAASTYRPMGSARAYGNLGRDDYTYPGYFTKLTTPDYNDRDTAQTAAGRWHFYRLRAEGKNCSSSTRVYASTRTRKVWRLCLSKVTQAIVLSTRSTSPTAIPGRGPYRRGIRLDRKSHRITVQDELQTRRRSDLWWQMATKADVTISKDGRVATLKMRSKSMVVRIMQPSKGARFVELPATYLFPGRSSR